MQGRKAPKRPSDELTRAERRQKRLERARRRMPQHGKGMGVMVRNALLRRATPDAARPAPDP